VKSAGTLVRKYRLYYGSGVTFGNGGRSVLTAVQEYGNDPNGVCTSLAGTDGVCLPAQTFGWQQGGQVFVAPGSGSWGANQANWLSPSAAPMLTGDFDGDGKTDIAVASNNGTITFQVHLSANPSAAPLNWTPTNPQTWWGDSASIFL